MNTSDGEDASQKDSFEDEQEKEAYGGSENEEEVKEVESPVESVDLKANGRLEVERLEEELEEEGDSDSEAEETNTVVAAAPILELDPFKEFADEEDLQRLSGVIDTWSSGLKKHLAAEFHSVKERLCLISRGAVANHHSELTARERSLKAQVERLRAELSASQKAERRKERLVERLGEEVARQKERVLLAARFADWRVLREREKREKFCLAIADLHNRRAIKRRALRAWQSSLAISLTGLLERRCRTRAEEVCARLASEHEERLQALNQQLSASRAELSAALSYQASMREEVRAALVRGVSALNSDPRKKMAPEFRPAEHEKGAEDWEEAAEEEEDDDDSDDRATYTLCDDGREKEQEKEKVIIATAPQRRVTTGLLLRAQPPPPEPRESRARHFGGAAVGRGAVFHHELPPGCHRPIAGQEAFETAAPTRPRTRSPVASVLVERYHGVNKRTVAPALHSSASRRLKT